MHGDRRCLIGTAVWGEWHVGAFLELNLPTLLAPQNLPAFATAVETTYRIYTTAADAERMRASPVFADLEKTLPVEIELLGREQIGAPIETHQRVWHELIGVARQRRGYVMLMPPDVAWSSRSLAHLAELIGQGKEAIFLNWHLRSVETTFIPSFFARHGRGQRKIEVPSRELVRLALEHAHPICGASLRDSTSYPHHSEMIFWPVAGQGLLMHVLALTPFVFDPNEIALSPTKLVAREPRPGALHFVTDSDDLFMVSLAPLGKDAAWYRQNHPLDPMDVAKWWLYYDSPVNDALARAPYRLHFEEPVERDWRRQEAAARLVILRLIASREALRVWQTLKELKCDLAAALLAYALEHGLATRLLPRGESTILLVPDDSGLRWHWDREVRDLLGPGGHTRLVALLRRHVITGERALAIVEHGSRALGGGARLKTGPHDVNGHRIYVITEPLPEKALREAADA